MVQFSAGMFLSGRRVELVVTLFYWIQLHSYTTVASYFYKSEKYFSFYLFTKAEENNIEFSNHILNN